jgi:adenine-specific DNA-methyltransferase
MSRLTDLIAQAKARDPKIGADLEREFKLLSSRLPFGLNFERHRPEAVELPLRPIRRGDKVRILPRRSSIEKGDSRLWRVVEVEKSDKKKVAQIRPLEASAQGIRKVSLDDLIVVAEFKDAIYPGLLSTGKVELGGNKPYHTVINGENYHVLKALTYTHRGKIDAIYIDPPFNSGARDWKYNNDYVESDDLYRHSKWLAMMERRLLVARELLNPACSALIVAIDEREYLRLGLLLEQTFPEASIQMVSSVIKPGGALRPGALARSDEYLFFLRFGTATIVAPRKQSGESEEVEVPWRSSLTRGDYASRRGTVKGGTSQFYPIFVDKKSHKIVGFGEPLGPSTSRNSVSPPPGCCAVFPVRPDGTEMNWGLVRESAQKLLEKGYLSAGPLRRDKPQPYPIRYLTSGKIADIEAGLAEVIERLPDGSVRAVYRGNQATEETVTTQWDRTSHSSTTYGTGVLKALLPGRRFPFPKSLYAVEDCLRLVVANKPDAIILDFFAGSGTTAHAVMRLNRQDGGQRQCISVTNNEVAANEHKALRERGLRPGDEEWERHGICEYITKPRVKAAITGKTPDGDPIDDDYKFIDEFPMADGFKENAEFFTLTYENPVAVNHNVAFARIAPLLWMRAGSSGRRINKVPLAGWEVVESYGLLIDLDQAPSFAKAVRKNENLRIAYVVTDDERRFQALVQRLPRSVEAVRLYESYLTNFAFANGEDA